MKTLSKLHRYITDLGYIRLAAFTIFLILISPGLTKGYCDPCTNNPNCGTFNEGIGTVIFNDIQNINSGCGTVCDGYSDFTHMSTVVTPGETYTLYLEDHDYVGGVGFAVWIDWENKGFFTEDDFVWSTAGTVKQATTDITIPEDAAPGELRMRIAGQGIGVPQPSNWCGQHSYGEVEDYTLVVPVPGPPTASFFAPDTMWTGGNYLLKSETPGMADHEWRVNGIFQSTDQNFLFVPDSAGNYQITLMLSNEEGSDQLARTIVVVDPTGPPEANFFSDKNFIIPEKVQIDAETELLRGVVNLYDFSKYGANAWQWSISPDTYTVPETGVPLPSFEFRDGQNLSTQNPGLLFVRPGNYDVALTASNNFGSNTHTRSDYLTVAHRMCSDFDQFNRSSALNGGLTDNEGKESYSGGECGFLIETCSQDLYIVFDKFELDCGSDLLRVYDGKDNAGIPLYNACSQKGLNGFTGTSDPAVINDLGCEPEDICVPPDTLWSTTGNFYIEYDAGSNPENLEGFVLRWNSEEKTVPPQPRFDAPESVCVDAPVTFHNRTTGSGIEAFAWDYLGDGIINDSLPEGSFSYPVPDTYFPRLYARDCAGLVDTFQKQITVINPSNPPEVSISASNQEPWANVDTIELSASIEGCLSDFNWNIAPNEGFSFVEGYGSGSDSPKLLFHQAGCYDVTFTAENAAGQTIITETCLIDVRQHCHPTVGQASEDIGISRVQLEGLDHQRQPGQRVYTDYSGDEDKRLILTKGETYTLTLSRQSASNPVSRAVWIDYNRNGSFDDSLELVAYQSNALTATYSAAFTVPGLAEAGMTRLRIGTGYGSASLKSCGDIQVGEYLDYSVEIRPDVTPPELTLTGSNPYVIEVFDTYDEPGAGAWDSADGDLTHLIEIENSAVNTHVVGEYTVHYSVTDHSGNIASKDRIVSVVDITDPEIVLHGDDTIRSEVNTDFSEPGYTVNDNYWGPDDLDVTVTTNLNMGEPGQYNKEYCVTDGSGNTSCAVRVIIVEDTTPPDIHLPADTIQAEVNEPFDIPDIPVTDNYWGPGDIDIEYSTFLNFPDELGFVEIEITAVDGSGNTATKVLIVEVVDTTPPEIRLLGSDLINLYRYQEYKDPGVVVTDNYDPAPDIITGGTFQGTDQKPGLYVRNYYAVDQSGNRSATVQRVFNIDPATALQDETDDGFLIYPNPTRGYVEIELKGIERGFTLTVTDVSGRLIMQDRFDGGGQGHELDISAFDPGTFILTIDDGVNQFDQRIILVD